MGDTIVTGTKLTALANSIRTKAGTQSSMTLDQMKTTVDNISTAVMLTPNNTIVSDDTTFVRAEVDASFDEQYEVTIPNTVTTILGACFNGNAFVTKITMPNSVTTINDGYDHIVQSGYIAGAMANCQRLKEVVLSENITVIPLGCFYNDTSLENLIIPDGVTQIKSQAFNNCTGLESIVIPDSCTSFGNSVFSNCESLTDIYYTGTQLEWEAITGLSNANIPAGATIHYEYSPSQEVEE